MQMIESFFSVEEAGYIEIPEIAVSPGLSLQEQLDESAAQCRCWTKEGTGKGR